MGARTRGTQLLVVVALASAALTALPSGASAAGSRPTTAQLDEGLLTTDDVYPIFEETDRRSLDAEGLADETRGPCSGPNTMAHAVALDDKVDVVTAAFGTETGGSLTEDVFSFTTTKQAKSFVKKNADQLKKCDTWTGLLQGAPRDFEVASVSEPDLGDQAFQANVAVAPVTARASGFDGELTRQTTFVRVGSVVASLLYLRSIDFPRKTPGRGYPQSAVAALEGAL